MHLFAYDWIDVPSNTDERYLIETRPSVILNVVIDSVLIKYLNHNKYDN